MGRVNVFVFLELVFVRLMIFDFVYIKKRIKKLENFV